MSTNVADRALLANLTVSMFGNTKADREATEKITKDYGAAHGSMKTSKILLPKIALIRVSRAKSSLEGTFNQLTLPFSGGARLLPGPNFLRLEEAVQQSRKKYPRLVKEDILDKYDDLKAEARQNLSRVYKEEDYPTKEQLAAKFGIYFDVTPLPSASQMAKFIDELGEARVKKYTAEIDAQFEEKFKRSMREVWDRLYDSVKHLKERVEAVSGGGRLHERVLTNLVDLVDLLPSLNVTADPDLTKLTERVKAELLADDVDEMVGKLKTDSAVRTKQVEVAADIMSKMDIFMGQQPA